MKTPINEIPNLITKIGNNVNEEVHIRNTISDAIHQNLCIREFLVEQLCSELVDFMIQEQLEKVYIINLYNNDFCTYSKLLELPSKAKSKNYVWLVYTNRNWYGRYDLCYKDAEGGYGEVKKLSLAIIIELATKLLQQYGQKNA
jgi:hypothetical protein